MRKNVLLKFFTTLTQLKKLRRTGWIERGVSNAESVSDHSFRMTVMALVLADKIPCDTDKLVQMCLIHDLHESISGDLILDYSRFGGTFKGVTPGEKAALERKAMTELFDLLEPKTQKKFKALWKEADEGQTREAQLLKQLDKFEMLLQASEYEIEKNYKKPVFDVFLEYNKPFITQPVLKQLLEEIEKTTH